MRSLVLFASLAAATVACSQPVGNDGAQASDITSSSKKGFVHLEQDPSGSLLVSAKFATSAGTTTTVNLGAACTLTSGTSGFGSSSANGGDIAVTLGAQNIALDFTAYNEYASQRLNDRSLFASGKNIAVVAQGGANVPAFSASLSVPAAVTRTAPVTSAGGGEAILTNDDDFEVAWTGGVAGDTVAVTFLVEEGVVECSFDAAAGHGSVPYRKSLRAIVGEVKPVALVVKTKREQVVDVGDYQVTVAALNDSGYGFYVRDAK